MRSSPRMPGIDGRNSPGNLRAVYRSDGSENLTGQLGRDLVARIVAGFESSPYLGQALFRGRGRVVWRRMVRGRIAWMVARVSVPA